MENLTASNLSIDKWDWFPHLPGILEIGICWHFTGSFCLFFWCSSQSSLGCHRANLHLSGQGRRKANRVAPNASVSCTRKAKPFPEAPNMDFRLRHIGWNQVVWPELVTIETGKVGTRTGRTIVLGVGCLCKQNSGSVSVKEREWKQSWVDN